jgi:thiol-disulfide isomerase/thioredoxin
LEGKKMKRFKTRSKLLIITLCASGVIAAKKTHNTAEGLGIKVPKNVKVSEDWIPLLNPKTDSFWKDVNGHLPDPGALLFFKKPTEDNAKLYLIRMNMKRNKARLFQRVIAKANLDLIRDGIIADDYGFSEQSKDGNKKTTVSLHDLNLALKDTNIFFFFSPHCPHCKTQAKILKGVDKVYPLQIGGKDLMHFEGLSKTDFAKDDDVKRFLKNGACPALLFVYENKISNISGVLTKEGIIEVVKKLKSGGSKNE